MADVKISALPSATTPLAGTEVLPIVQSGTTDQVTVANLTAGRAITATSVNKVTLTTPATGSTLTVADGKTLTANNSITLAGTDTTTMTFPTTSATIARTDAGQTFTGTNAFGLVTATSVNKVALTAPATGSTLTVADGKTLTANNSITLAGTDTTTMTFPTTSATIARTDAGQTFTGVNTFTNPTFTNYTESVVAIGNSGSAQTLDLTSGTLQTVTLSASCTFTMPTATAGKSFTLIVTQNGTGNWTATFTSVKWPKGTAPVITPTATTGVDVLTFVANGTSWFGTFLQAFA